ncbi:hypothetical protein JL39_07700 [Rhizobium sp. YS-1r]|nr:hypothetical protein JL39_07700 [Rhizobium sp. YS-1r]
MPEDLQKRLTSAIRIQIDCLSQPTLNGFAGTGRYRQREKGSLHAIATRIMDEGLRPYAFECGGEPVDRHDVYLTVLTALFDIDDEDARRWTSRGEWDAARFEAAKDIARAVMRKFTVVDRPRVYRDIPADGQMGGAHSHSNWRFEGE